MKRYGLPISLILSFATPWRRLRPSGAIIDFGWGSAGPARFWMLDFEF